MNMPMFKTLNKPIVFIFLGYIILLILLLVFGFLSLNDLLNNITVFLGWVLALLILFIQLRRTLTDNLTIQREEKRKTFEIDAFKEINKAVTSLSSKVEKLAIVFIITRHSLEFHIKAPDSFKFSLPEIEKGISEDVTKIAHARDELYLSVQAYEIAVIKFDHLLKFIKFRFNDIGETIDNFINFLQNTGLSKLYEETSKLEFEQQCKKISDGLIAISAYLYDYRIVLMNYFLEEIFNTTVPARNSKDPNVKTLTEVAKKDEVMKGEEIRS